MEPLIAISLILIARYAWCVYAAMKSDLWVYKFHLTRNNTKSRLKRYK